jgi:hypothetical protein
VLAPYGGGRAFTITPDVGYHIVDVLVDGSSVGAVPTYTFTNVTANHTISATFAINIYTITASAGAHGAIVPSGRDERAARLERSHVRDGAGLGATPCRTCSWTASPWARPRASRSRT